ncbi:Protein of unknown function [Micrococcales bacterium KH10]|nr:Protein of unknown function [Micrococcales bacterium KH10]
MSHNSSSAPAPLEVNISRVFIVGTSLWTIALIAVLIWDWTSDTTLTGWITVCGFGIGLGLAGLVWTRFTRRPGARQPALEAADAAP